MAITYNDLYIDSARALGPLCDSSQAAKLEARELICSVSGKSLEQFTQDQFLYTTDAIVEAVQAMVERRKAGEPIAYVIGQWDFCGLTFEINPSVLIPRTDTEMLANLAIKRAEELPGNIRVLDLCAGSGCVGITIAHRMKNARAVLVDLSDGALELCKKNIRRHKLTGRVVYLKGDAMLPPSHALGQFDLLVSNPPYIPSGDIPGLDREVRDFEPVMALDGGEDGLDFYRAITKLWKSALKPGGLLLCEVGIGQSEKVAYMLAKAGFQKICITRDTGGIDRVVEGIVPKLSEPLHEKTEEET